MRNVFQTLRYVLPLGLLITVTGCATTDGQVSIFSSSSDTVKIPAEVKSHYASVVDGGFKLPAVDVASIDKKYWRQIVNYHSKYPAGTIVVQTKDRFLYLILNDYKAIRYGVGVGKAGLEFKGNAVIGAKVKWPHWSPTKDMMVRDPDRYGHIKGMNAGVDNPLGARALYLYKDGHDTCFRIHGSHEDWSIGKAMSSGCIRMLNQDVMDLFNRVKVGTKVIILSGNDKPESDITDGMKIGTDGAVIN